MFKNTPFTTIWFRLPSLGFAFMSMLAATTYAATQTEEVYVTGELRTQSVLEVSNSVSVVTEEAIKKREAQNLEDLLNLAPNVNFSQGASRGRFIQIRGIGERSQFIEPINPSVGVIVDGIDFTGIATGVTALDTKQVEVFRGPQGTLYGANALAGLINVVGNAPSDEFYVSFGGGAGNFGSYDTNATISTPLGEHAGWRLAAMKTVSDGFIDNAFLNRDDTNDIDELSVRNHVVISPTENLNISLTSFFIDIDNGYDAFSLANTRTTLSDEPGQDRQETVAHALNLDYTGWNIADIDATLSYADSETEYGYDEDWAFSEICAGQENCFPYTSTDNYERDNDNISADIRLSSKTDSNLGWAFGVYHREQQVDLLRTYTFSDLYNSEYDTENTAVYGELDVALNAHLRLVTGLRYETFSSEFSDTNLMFSPDDNLWGGRIALEYLNNNNTLYYALVSRGYKAGGVNTDNRITDSDRLFETETMVNYEIGTKGSWLDDTLTAQLAAFYQERHDTQVRQSFALAREDEPGFDFPSFIDNADGASNYGIEVELNYLLNEDTVLFAAFGLLQTEFKDFVNKSHVNRNEDTGEGYQMDGREQAHAPNYQYFVGADVRISEPLSLRVELEGKDDFYFSNSHDEQSDAIALLNARLEYKIDALVLALWAKNLSNETVETRGFFFGNDPRTGYTAQLFTQQGAPRTFGVSAQFTF